MYSLEFDSFVGPLCIVPGSHFGPTLVRGFLDLVAGGPFGTLQLNIPALFQGSTPKPQANCKTFPPIVNSQTCGLSGLLATGLTTGGTTSFIICPP